MATITVENFRRSFPQFGGTPDARVAFWLEKADIGITPDRFGDKLRNRAAMLYVAHNLTRRTAAIAMKGGRPAKTKEHTGLWSTTPHGQRLVAMEKDHAKRTAGVVVS